MGLQIGQNINALTRTKHALPEVLPAWGVRVLESHHSSEFKMDWRNHDFLKIVYALKGNGTFFVADQRMDFSPGDVIVVPPGMRNRIEDCPNAATSLYICCIAKTIWHFDRTIPSRAGSQIYHRDSHFTHRIASAMRRMIHQQTQPELDQPISMVSDAIKILEMLIQRHQPKRTDWAATDSDKTIIEGYISSLPSRFFEDQSIDQVCQSLGVSRRTFTKHFQQLTGSTWLHYVRVLAINHAKKRLRHTDLPVTSIAFECGFNDLSTFYRQFKRHCGMAPSVYRQTESV